MKVAPAAETMKVAPATTSPVVSVTLLKEESAWGYAEVAATTTVTFFKGCPSHHVDEFLKQRLTAILTANPWLTGSLNKAKGATRLSLD
jgi:hypothetical protein